MRLSPIALLLVGTACASTPPLTRTQAQPPLRARSTSTRIAFGACAKQSDPQPVWSVIAATRPNLFLFIGDNVYADRDGPASPEDLSAAYAALGLVPEFQRFRAQVRIEATWDDHDYGKNDGGREYPHRAAARAAFLDFFDVPAEDVRRSREGVYHAFTVGEPGRRVQVILLDTRSFRSPLHPRPEGESWWWGRWAPSEADDQAMLGEAQWAWLEARLQEPAELRLLVSSIQVVAEDHGWEKWQNLPAERARLFDLLAKTAAEGVLILSGDRHKGELSVMDAGLGYPLYDFTSSGLNTGHERWFHFEANQHRVATMRWGDNFGLIDVDWSAEDPQIELKLMYADGTPAFVHRLRASTLRKGALPDLPPRRSRP